MATRSYDATSAASGPAPSIAVVGLQIATGLLLTHPLGAVDTVFKVNYQPTKAIADTGVGANAGKLNRYNNTLDAARGVVEADGYLGLLRALVPSFGYTLLYSTGFETFYQIYQRVPFHATPLAQLAARDFAIAAWRGVISPLRTLTTRLLVRPSARSAVPGPLAFDPVALWNASTDAEERQKPWLLFRPSIALLETAAAVTGQIANSLVAVPVTEIFYAVATRGLTHLKKDEWQQIATLSAVASAGVAVRLANVAIETVSRRLQAQPATSSSSDSYAAVAKVGQTAAHATEADSVVVLRPVPYKGALDAFQRIYEEEGITGLLHGWGVQLGGTVGIAAITIGLARAQGRI